MKTAPAYTSKNIQTLTFPNSVRRNASQYIGGTDAYGLWIVVKELLDNALDEALANRNDLITLFFGENNDYWIADDGDGIPQGVTRSTVNVNGKDVVSEMPTMQAVFGSLHTSGKYDKSAYETSVGSHGIGSKATNATALYFDVWTCYKGAWYTVRFARGVLQQPVSRIKEPPRMPWGEVPARGTIINFKPDPDIFSTSNFPQQYALDWAEIMSYFTPGLEINLVSKKRRMQFLSDAGPRGLILKRLEKSQATYEKDMFEYRAQPGDENAADVIVAFSSVAECDMRGYTNGSYNAKGGKHVDSVIAALYEGIKPFIKTRKVNGKAVPVFNTADLKEGLCGIVNAKLHKAKFNSQDKVYLADERMGVDFKRKVQAAASAFFNSNKSMAQRICDKAARIAELKTRFVASKTAALKLAAVKKAGLPTKFASYDSRTPVAERELLIVEGDSAGGTCLESRYPNQGILPIRGKIMNTLKAEGKTPAIESEEIINILASIGFDFKAEDPYSTLTVGKIICLADPDPDGPFVADTLVNVRLDGVEQTVRIAELGTRAFQVKAYHGGTVNYADATARLVHNTDTLIAITIGHTRYRVDPQHRFMCLNTPAVRARLDLHVTDPTLWLAAKDMRVGDRVLNVLGNGHKDKMTKLDFVTVSKAREQKLNEPVPVYCLTVPHRGNFVLPDGTVSHNCHINTLLLALFYRYLPELFDRGMMYIADAPEFYATYRGGLFVGETLSEVRSKLAAVKAPVNTPVNHVKGYGELDAPLLRVMVMNAETRKLIRIGALVEDDHVEFVRLMGDDVQYRRELLGLPSNRKTK